MRRSHIVDASLLLIDSDTSKDSAPSNNGLPQDSKKVIGKRVRFGDVAGVSVELDRTSKFDELSELQHDNKRTLENDSGQMPRKDSFMLR